MTMPILSRERLEQRASNSAVTEETAPHDDNLTASDDNEPIIVRLLPPTPALSCVPSFRRLRTASNPTYDECQLRMNRRRRTISSSAASTASTRSSFAGSVGSSFDESEEDEGSSQFTEATPPTLPPAPYPVDPYHFHCRVDSVGGEISAAPALVQELRRLLLECDIEFTYQPHKCKFKCVKYVHYSQVEFVVRVYSTSGDDGVLLVEFQRRSGSVLLWDGLYSMLYHQLHHWVDAAAPPCPQSGTQKKVAARDSDSLSVQVWNKLAATQSVPTSGVEAMKIMISSNFADAQREGCAGLAVITEDPESAFHVAQFGIVEYLVQAAAVEDLEMARCAIGALGNTARALRSFPDEKLAARTLDLMKTAAPIIVGVLEKNTNSRISLELLRECARALEGMGRICPAEVVGCQGSVQLEHHVNHCDQKLSTLCREALQGLRA